MKSTNAGLEESQQPVTTEVIWQMPMPDSKKVDQELLRQAPEGTTTIIIPHGVEKIGSKAFNITKLSHLKKVFVPGSISNSSVLPSWEGAFWGCPALEEVILEDGIECIDSKAFQGCVNLKKVVMSNSLNEIDDRAFYGCQNLEILKIQESAELEVKIGRWAFYDCKSLKDVSNLKARTMGSGAFSESGIESFVVDNNARYIVSAAFRDCADLKEFVFPPHAVPYDGELFLRCNALELLVLPDDCDQFSGDEQAALKDREFMGIQPDSQVHIQASSEYLKDKFNKMLETDCFSGEDGRVNSAKIPLLKELERIHTGQYPEKNEMSKLMITLKELSLPDILKVVKEIKNLKRKEVWVQWCGNFLDGLRGVTQDAGNDPVSHTSDLRGAAEVSNMPTQQADEDLNKKIEVMLKRFHDESLTLGDFARVRMVIKGSNNTGSEMTTVDSEMTETGLDIALGRLGLGLFDKDLEAEGGAKSGLGLDS